MARTRLGAVGALAFVVVIALGVLVLVLWPRDPPLDYRPAQATVVQRTGCDGEDQGDVVRLELDGELVIAVLEGCGNRFGSRLAVEVARVPETSGFSVRPVGAGVAPESITARRVSAVLATAAGAAGAVLAWRLCGGPPRRPLRRTRSRRARHAAPRH